MDKHHDDDMLNLDLEDVQVPKKKPAAKQAAPARPVKRTTAGRKRRRRRRRRLTRQGKMVLGGAAVVLLVIILLLSLLVKSCSGSGKKEKAVPSTEMISTEALAETGEEMAETGEEGSEAESTEAGIQVVVAEPEAEEETAAPAPLPEEPSDTITSFNPTHTDDTDPGKFISKTSIEVDGKVLAAGQKYEPLSTITFEEGSKYTEMDGVITFRGNNFRSSPSYGVANMVENKMKAVWSQETRSTVYKGKTWSGSGWTGQPLITTWPKEVRQHMNMYDWAKEKETLTEVIYATLDGHIYFLELVTGKATREPMKIGFTFKGAGALDPRGYPIMYLGSGYNSSKGKSRVFVINLLDCSVMYTFGNSDPFAKRSCFFFDSSALVDAETDTLIYPGESGILYLIHLNTKYDPQAGTLSIDPDHTVKWNYTAKRNSKKKYWYGMEDSAVIYKGYLFIADNGANLMCLNLNTLELVWVQDTLDDTNCSPVLSVEDGHPYIYISTSFHKGWRKGTYADIPIFKVDAENGSIVWQTVYKCSTIEDVSGGVQSTAALGKHQLKDYVYVTVARTGGQSKGVLTCLKKETGEIVWEHEAAYAWSSPVCVYGSDGSGKVIYADGKGQMYLLDGKTGEQLDQIALSKGVIESSPAVYNNMLVIGIRARKIWGVKLK